jgi:hypothetical protein
MATLASNWIDSRWPRLPVRRHAAMQNKIVAGAIAVAAVIHPENPSPHGTRHRPVVVEREQV